MAMADHKEMSIADYGKTLFRVMTKKDGYMGEFWRSIQDEARPLVYKLIEINNRRSDGYKLIEYDDIKGSKVLSDFDKVAKAQKAWLVKAKDLKEGDRIFFDFDDYPYSMQDGYDEPETVLFVKKETVYIDTSNWGVVKLEYGGRTDEVWRVPADWDERSEEYLSQEYWLKQYEEQ